MLKQDFGVGLKQVFGAGSNTDFGAGFGEQIPVLVRSMDFSAGSISDFGEWWFEDGRLAVVWQLRVSVLCSRREFRCCAAATVFSFDGNLRQQWRATASENGGLRGWRSSAVSAASTALQVTALASADGQRVRRWMWQQKE